MIHFWRGCWRSFMGKATRRPRRPANTMIGLRIYPRRIMAAAVRDNVRPARGRSSVVIGTEYEPEKARAAREHFEQSGLSNFIDLREGDLRDTLRSIDGPVDFMLVDIWIPMSRPALELVAPHLRPGAIVICDNTEQHRAAYADYFAFINDPTQRFRTMTLPFGGGLEMSVRAI